MYRDFLRILNAPDRPARNFCYVGPDLGRDIKQGGDVRVFTDWEFGSSDQDEATKSFIDGIVFDVDNNNMWLDQWGQRPETAQGWRDRITSLISEAPALIRVHGHRFMLSTLPSSPILSIHQSDAIIYAYNLEEMLLKDFPKLAGRRSDLNREKIANTPFWGDLVR